MEDVKLTDFTVEQLQILLVEVVAGCQREDNHKIVGFTSIKYDALCLWRTQILNAISTVQMREKITNS